jgi:hypothetical protein
VRPIRVGAALLAVTALIATGCSGESDAPDAPLAFCRPAANYDHALSTKGRDLPLARQIRYLRAMVAAAPREIVADARVFLDALERRQEDTSVVDNPKVKRAVENVNRYAAQGCDFYARQSGGI